MPLEDDFQAAQIRVKTFGFVFQQFNLVARTSALENVALPLQMAGDANAFERARRPIEDPAVNGRQLNGAACLDIPVRKDFGGAIKASPAYKLAILGVPFDEKSCFLRGAALGPA